MRERDVQNQPPLLNCTMCGGELYRGDSWLEFDGRHVCRGCFLRYATEYFGAELTQNGVRKDEFCEAD